MKFLEIFLLCLNIIFYNPSYCITKLKNAIYNSYNRIVIKIGSAVLADSDGRVNHTILSSISEDVAWLIKNGKEVLIVSSGAIALGRKKIKFSENLTLPESQALAAHGQIELMSAWKKHLNKFSIPIRANTFNSKRYRAKTFI